MGVRELIQADVTSLQSWCREAAAASLLHGPIHRSQPFLHDRRALCQAWGK